MGENPTGVGVYSEEILRGLAEAQPEVAFEWWRRFRRFRTAENTPLPPNVRLRLLAEPLGPRSADLFHGLNQRLPKVRLRRAITTFHDLFVLTGEYSTPEFRARFAAQARDAAERSDLIVAVSEFTRQQVIGLLKIEPSRVRVVHHGMRRMELPPAVRRENIILSVGAIQKRKNTTRLVEAFEAVDRDWRLVLAGSLGFGAEETLARIAKSPARDRIETPGYVEEQELASWHARASVFAFPSLDEGFGMPVLDAMAAGIPVVASNRSAVPEVAGDAARLVDPEDTAALADALRALTSSKSLRQEMAGRGAERARLFTWEKAVRETWRLYREILG